jgi:hypothetical protein
MGHERHGIVQGPYALIRWAGVEGSSCTNAALMKPEAWPQTQLQPIRYNHREKRAFYGAV